MSELQDTADHVVIVGRGNVIADTSVADLLASVSGDRVILRTAKTAQAATVLAKSGAEVAATGPGTLTIAGLPAERAVVLLSAHAIPFSEVTAHRATLEEAYLELTKDAIEFRLNQMRAELGRATFGIDEDVLNERIGALSGKVAVIRVGAATNAELKELQHRVEDALSATRAAMAEGIVAGGGATLLHSIGALDDLSVSGDYAIGVGIVRRSLSEPAYLISANAGYPAAEIVEQTAGMGVDEGFDALQGRHGNMIEMGIIDPLRVVRSALQNGASVAGLLLTTNTLVAEEQTPWGGSPALMTEFGSLDEGLHQPSPDASTPQSLGLGPSVG